MSVSAVVRMGIPILLAFAVLAHGAVEPWSLLVVQLGAGLLLLLWGLEVLRRRETNVQVNALSLLLFAVTGFGLLQAWAGLSVYPYLTQVEVLKLVTLLVLVFLASQVFTTTTDLRRFVWFLLTFGFAVAFFAIIQSLTFDQKLYWVREMPYGGGLPFGPYVNRNHFAGFVELIIPIGLALLFLRGVKRDLYLLLGLFVAVMIGALFLSTSRGGIAALLFEGALLACFLWRLEGWRFKAGRTVTGVAIFLLLLAVFVAWLGIGPAFKRFAQLASGELGADFRLSIARATGSIFLENPWGGTGLGTFMVVYPQYASVDTGKLVDYAHNDYLQLLSETGMVGLGAIIVFLLGFYVVGVRRLRQARDPFERGARLGAIVACSGMLLHSLVDFNLHIPANALLFFLLATLATNGTQRESPRASQIYRPISRPEVRGRT